MMLNIGKLIIKVAWSKEGIWQSTSDKQDTLNHWISVAVVTHPENLTAFEIIVWKFHFAAGFKEQEGKSMKNIIKPNMLRFKRHSKLLDSMEEDSVPRDKGTMFGRFIARHSAAAILNDKTGHYQFGGSQGSLSPAYIMIDADKHQLAHWILSQAGYCCCPADLMELTGTPVE